MEIPITQKVLIIGSGPAACHAALQLSQKRTGIVLAEAGKELAIRAPSTPYEPPGVYSALCSSLANSEGIEVLTDTRVCRCQGGAGNFLMVLNQNGNLLQRTVGVIIIGVEPKIEANFAVYRLTPSDVTVSLSETGNALGGISVNNPKVAFLTGLHEESNALIMQEVMSHALYAQTALKGQAYVFTNNIKVGGDGLEALYQKSRKEGVRYFKFTDTRPEIVQDKTGGTRIELTDELVSQAFFLAPNITVVDETLRPSDLLDDLAQVLGLDKDSEGFLQANNIHRATTFSNRKGILVIGPARKIQSLEGQLADAENAAMATACLLAQPEQRVSANATIHPGKCTICLTCYRVCPHGAIRWNSRAIIMPEACQGCGICAAECPMDAIQIEPFTDQDIVSRIKEGKTPEPPARQGQFIPRIVAFCCNHSGYPAMELAAWLGYSLPLGLHAIHVPCAGKIDLDHVLKSFEDGADGVIIMACHKGNCCSERGNIYAARRAVVAREMLKEVGLEEDRIFFKNIASNMASEFFDTVKHAEKKIEALGPNPLKGASVT